MNKLLTEFIGTFFLVLVIALSVPSAGMMAPLAIGLMLMAMVYMGGPISGAHYNPAVTLAILIRGAISLPLAIQYMVVQLAAAVLAALIGQMALNRAVAPAAWDLKVEGHGMFPVWLAEILFTFALALVVLNVATVKRTSANSYYGLAIGMTVTAGAYAVGNISGAAFNPAVGVGMNLVKWMKDPVADNARAALNSVPLYLLAPMAGAALAAVVFKVQHGADADRA
jgi:aquaporin Z